MTRCRCSGTILAFSRQMTNATYGCDTLAGQKLPKRHSIFRAASSSMRWHGAPTIPPPSERHHDQKSGNESSDQDFRSTRPSLAVNYTAHAADSQRFLTEGPLFSKQALAQIAKSGGLRFQCGIASRARKRESYGRGWRRCWRFLTRTRLVMRNRVDVDPKHSRAIVQEIGGRLRAFLKEEPELPGSLKRRRGCLKLRRRDSERACSRRDQSVVEQEGSRTEPHRTMSRNSADLTRHSEQNYEVICN